MRIRLLALLLAFSIPQHVCAQYRDTTASVLSTKAGKIYGTLTMPRKTKGPVPVAIIIPGSGPTDRNGNSGSSVNNSLRMLSDSLSKHGIASLRYDKRGIGASKAAAPHESNLLFSDYVTDVVGWFGKLRQDKRFTKVFIIGHSEGSLVGMLAAKKAPVGGYISIAGAGWPVDAVITEQLRVTAQMPPPMLDTVKMFFAELKRGETIVNVPPGFYQTIFRPTVQRYLASWMQYDPATEIAGVKAPTLIIQGTTDMQVDTMQAHILADARPGAQLLIIQNMNHILKDVAAEDREGNLASYFDPAMPVKTDLVKALTTFIRQSPGKK